MSDDPNNWREIREKYHAGHASLVLPKNVQAPAQMRMSIQKGLLTIELERQVGILQFSKEDASKFIQAIVNYYNLMENPNGPAARTDT